MSPNISKSPSWRTYSSFSWDREYAKTITSY